MDGVLRNNIHRLGNRFGNGFSNSGCDKHQPFAGARNGLRQYYVADGCESLTHSGTSERSHFVVEDTTEIPSSRKSNRSFAEIVGGEGSGLRLILSKCSWLLVNESRFLSPKPCDESRARKQKRNLFLT